MADFGAIRILISIGLLAAGWLLGYFVISKRYEVEYSLYGDRKDDVCIDCKYKIRGIYTTKCFKCSCFYPNALKVNLKEKRFDPNEEQPVSPQDSVIELSERKKS